MAEWWESLTEAEREKALDIPGLSERLAAKAAPACACFTPELRDALLALLFASGSDLLLLPVQDVFGWRERVNVPASHDPRNWTWRLPWPVDRLMLEPESRERAEKLRGWSDESGRWPRLRHSGPRLG